MQYKLDTTANTKIPDNLVHKLPFECFRNQFQCLERLWFNFKIYGISKELLVVFSTPFSISYNCRTRKLNIFLSLRIPDKTDTANSRSQLKTTGRKIEINTGVHSTDRQSDQLKNRIFYKNFSEYANFITFSHKGHKTKGQIL